MKQNIIMIIILISLFFFGLLIYDFSDELDTSVSEHKWYRIEENKPTVIDLSNREFSYYYQETGEPVGDYQLCTGFRFNRSINVIKLNHSFKQRKIYIVNKDEKELNLTIEGKEKIFYATEELAVHGDFIANNNLTKDQFAELMNIDLEKFDFTTVNDILKLYKNKNTGLIALVSSEKSIQNALNVKALFNFNTHSSLAVLNLDNILTKDLAKLNKLTKDIPEKEEEINKNKISIYKVGNKKFELMKQIEVTTFNEIDNYNNI